MFLLRRITYLRLALLERDLAEFLLHSNPSVVFKEQLEAQVAIAAETGVGEDSHVPAVRSAR